VATADPFYQVWLKVIKEGGSKSTYWFSPAPPLPGIFDFGQAGVGVLSCFLHPGGGPCSLGKKIIILVAARNTSN